MACPASPGQGCVLLAGLWLLRAGWCRAQVFSAYRRQNFQGSRGLGRGAAQRQSKRCALSVEARPTLEDAK